MQPHLSSPIVTYTLMGICIVVALFTNVGKSNPDLVMSLMIDNPLSRQPQQLWQTQPWRLITPIFLHFGFLHILFNLLWLNMLGKSLESFFGASRLLLVVMISGLAGNLAEYVATGPGFGGLSGVVYGLLGYFWLYSQQHPQGPLRMPFFILAQMLLWFFLCWSGFIGQIANYAHTGGLVAGLILGTIDAKRDRQFRQRTR